MCTKMASYQTQLTETLGHCLREAGAGGSNPLTPTIFQNISRRGTEITAGIDGAASETPFARGEREHRGDRVKDADVEIGAEHAQRGRYFGKRRCRRSGCE